MPREVFQGHQGKVPKAFGNWSICTEKQIKVLEKIVQSITGKSFNTCPKFFEVFWDLRTSESVIFGKTSNYIKKRSQEFNRRVF